MSRITSKDEEILEYIRRFIMTRGYSPTIREICGGVGLKSTSSVYAHMIKLLNSGYLITDNDGLARARAYRPVENEPNKIAVFTIELAPVTKKNHSQIIMTGKYPRLIPSKPYREYQEACQWFMPKLPDPIEIPVNIKALYYMPTRRKVDLCNLHAALHDILVHYKVIKDDNANIVVSTDGSRVLYSKEHPRTEVTITDGDDLHL